MKGPDIDNEPSELPREALIARIQDLQSQLDREHARSVEGEATASRVEELTAQMAEVGQQLRLIRGSGSYVVAEVIRRGAATILPPGSMRRKAIRRAFVRLRPQPLSSPVDRHTPLEQRTNNPYGEWCRDHDASAFELARQAASAGRIPQKVGFSAIIFSDSNSRGMGDTLGSLATQSWPQWSASVVGTLSAEDVNVRQGERVRVTAVTPSLGIGGVVRDLVQRQPSADATIFLWPGDTLAADCLYQAALTLRRDPMVDLVTWDDDVGGSAGNGRQNPRIRPSWSPDMLLSANYIGSAFAIRNRTLLAAGGLDGDDPRLAVWTLLLRGDLTAERVERIPRILSHVVGRPDASNGQHLQAVVDFLRVSGSGRTASLSQNGAVRIDSAEPSPHTTIIVRSRGDSSLRRCLKSVETTDRQSFDVMAVAGPESKSRWVASDFAALDLTFAESQTTISEVAARARGEILVFLDGDLEIVDPGWLRELTVWAARPEIGAAGLQALDPSGRIASAGVIVGLNGLADQLFKGMAPGAMSILGATSWYRNVLAPPPGCLAIRRSTFDAAGGFDQHLTPPTAAVALALELHRLGFRNVSLPFAALQYQPSGPKLEDDDKQDRYAAYWRYHPYLFGGDPYFSPSLSLTATEPTLRSPSEPAARSLLSQQLGRPFPPPAKENYVEDAWQLVDFCRATPQDVQAVHDLHRRNQAPFEPRTINWFIPGFESPFYGGINTAFRIADHLLREHGTVSRFVVWDRGPEAFIRAAITAAFPRLESAPITLYDGTDVPAADVAIATMWVTAYMVTRFSATRRKFYLVQDFEPMFYPGGSLSALAEETYRLGLYGLCNTETLRSIYQGYGAGRAFGFTPAVDPAVFHAARPARRPGAPITIFAYARPNHRRNCWELVSQALGQVKDRLGDRVRIVAAGSWAVSGDRRETAAVKQLGLLDYRSTGSLYRACDIGLTLSTSKHPSYLPLELMGCGVPVVAFDNPAGNWLLRDNENSLLTEWTVDGVADALERLVVDAELRQRLAGKSQAQIAAEHSSWSRALSGIYGFLCDPEGSESRGVEVEPSRTGRSPR